MFVYRISQTKYAHLLTSHGYPGRWNSNGQHVLYTGGSAALSCLEVAVHKSGASLLSGNFSMTTFKIPQSMLIEEIRMADLTPKADDWFTVGNYHLTQGIGDKWLQSQTSAVLKVPSAIIQNEFNYLLNVNHSDFGRIKIVTISKFAFDPRLKTG